MHHIAGVIIFLPSTVLSGMKGRIIIQWGPIVFLQ